MCSLVSEIWKFKDSEFKSRIACRGNRLHYVLAAVDRVINGTIASNESLLRTILHYNVYSALKCSGKLCFPSEIASHQQNVDTGGVLFAQLAVKSVQQICRWPGRQIHCSTKFQINIYKINAFMSQMFSVSFHMLNWLQSPLNDATGN